MAAPAGIQAVCPGARAAGRVLPARHYGSVDVFLEALETSEAGDVLVIDNGGRRDEGCIGDLITLEAREAGLAAVVVWGCHRDSRQIAGIGLPVFSCGAFPTGPLRLDPREADALASARMGPFLVGREHTVLADEDGVVFIPAPRLEAVLNAAEAIVAREREQASALQDGRSLREQLRFRAYLEARAADPARSFRRHLRSLGGAIEE